ncbi:Cathepsin B [Nymphon striatum]|nr:Cathepsin B [Nymphon striatum]
MVSLLMAITLAKSAAFLDESMDPLSDEYINMLNTMNSTWTAGRNFPKHTPLSHVRRLVSPKKENNVKLPVMHSEPANTIPEEFDARVHWPQCPSIGEIRDQGQCASSWAFAAVETMTDRICIQSKGWIHFIKEGLVTGGPYNSHSGCRPYTIPDGPGPRSRTKTPKCIKKCQPGYNKTYTMDKHHGQKTYAIVPSQAHIKTDIMTNGPVAAYFMTYADFPNYKSGVYERSSLKELGMLTVKILGWGVENGSPYWLAANSWNTSWGMNVTLMGHPGRLDPGGESRHAVICDGGDPPPSLLYFIHEGLVTGGAYHSHSGCRPYTIPDDSGPEKKTPKCVKHCEAGYNKTYNTDKHYGKTSYSLRPSVAQIQKEIMTNGPVVADFDVYADFPNYKSGVYIRHSDDQVGGHSVKIIGWGVERKVPYWLVANSWNTDWGLKGFFKIRRGTDECGIEDNMVAGIPR